MIHTRHLQHTASDRQVKQAAEGHSQKTAPPGAPVSCKSPLKLPPSPQPQQSHRIAFSITLKPPVPRAVPAPPRRGPLPPPPGPARWRPLALPQGRPLRHGRRSLGRRPLHTRRRPGRASSPAPERGPPWPSGRRASAQPCAQPPPLARGRGAPDWGEMLSSSGLDKALKMSLPRRSRIRSSVGERGGARGGRVGGGGGGGGRWGEAGCYVTLPRPPPGLPLPGAWGRRIRREHPRDPRCPHVGGRAPPHLRSREAPVPRAGRGEGSVRDPGPRLGQGTWECVGACVSVWVRV